MWRLKKWITEIENIKVVRYNKIFFKVNLANKKHWEQIQHALKIHLKSVNPWKWINIRKKWDKDIR